MGKTGVKIAVLNFTTTERHIPLHDSASWASKSKKICQRILSVHRP